MKQTISLLNAESKPRYCVCFNSTKLSLARERYSPRGIATTTNVPAIDTLYFDDKPDLERWLSNVNNRELPELRVFSLTQLVAEATITLTPAPVTRQGE